MGSNHALRDFNFSSFQSAIQADNIYNSQLETIDIENFLKKTIFGWGTLSLWESFSRSFIMNRNYGIDLSESLQAAGGMIPGTYTRTASIWL